MRRPWRVARGTARKSVPRSGTMARPRRASPRRPASPRTPAGRRRQASQRRPASGRTTTAGTSPRPRRTSRWSPRTRRVSRPTALPSRPWPRGTRASRRPPAPILANLTDSIPPPTRLVAPWRTMRVMGSLPRLAFLGHSTVLIELEGLRILTDPVLLDRVIVLRRIVTPVEPALYSGIDAVVLSHLHLDHFDLASLRVLGPDVQVVVPRGAASLLRRSGFERVTELAPGEATSIGGLSVTATRAAHGGFRPPFGPRAAAVGFLLEGRESRIYFPGDTDLLPEKAELGADLDVALLPVWGWGPTLGPGHLDPARAAIALRLLRPSFAMPIHWGTFWPYGLGRVRPGLLTEPPREFAALAAEAHPQGTVLLAAPGEHVSFTPSRRRDI